MSKEYTYSMPQQFIDDPNVALKWKLYGYLNGFWIAGKPVYARNDTLAKHFGKTERAVQEALAELEKMGLITRDIKGLSRYILPGGLKDEGRSPASPQDEAQLRGGTKPSFTIVHIDKSDSINPTSLRSGISSLEGIEEVSISDETNEKQKEPADPNVKILTAGFRARCKSEFDREPSWSLSAGWAVTKRALSLTTESNLRDMMELWFDGDKKQGDMMQITQCWSPYRIDKYLSEYE